MVFALAFVPVLVAVVAIGVVERFIFALSFMRALVALVAAGVAIRTADVPAFVAIRGARRTAFARALGPAAVVGIAMPTSLVTALEPLAPVGVAIRTGLARALGPAAVIGIAMPTGLVTALGPLAPIGVAIRSAFAALRRAERKGLAVVPRRPPVRLVFALAALDDAVEPFAD